MSNPVSKDAVSPPSVSSGGEVEAHSSRNFGVLALGSIGVVFGDIGTSPLYALKTALGQLNEGALGAPSGHRRRLAHHLGAAARRHRKIRAVPDAGGQQGRRRHAVAGGARAERPGPTDDDRVSAGRRRVGPFFRRRDYHSGDFGAFRARRIETGRRRSGALCAAGDDRHPCAAVRRPEPRHGPGCGLLQPDHGDVLRRQRRTWAYRISPPPGSFWRP